MGHRPAAARAGPCLRRGDPHATSRSWPPSPTRAPSRRCARGTRPGTSSTSPRTATTDAHDATARWLDAIGLPYDELYCSCDKVARCGEIGIDVLIDDSPVNLAGRSKRASRRDARAPVEPRHLRGGGHRLRASDWPALAARSSRSSREPSRALAPAPHADRDDRATCCPRSSPSARSPTGAARSASRG